MLGFYYRKWTKNEDNSWWNKSLVLDSIECLDVGVLLEYALFWKCLESEYRLYGAKWLVSKIYS